MKNLLISFLVLLPLPAASLDHSALLTQAVQEHILPGYRNLATTTQTLKNAAIDDCAFQSSELQSAYHSAFDAWIAVSHLRFGPSEDDNRAFSMAFWPDKKGFTAKALSALISDQDAIVDTPLQFATYSIAGRGFFALDMLMFDARYADADANYTCRLVRAITADISNVSDAIRTDWDNEYAEILLSAGSDTNPVYMTPDEGVQELFKAVLTGMEFTQAQRIGRPMGSFERQRPSRAEAWRSKRSQRNIVIALQATQQLTDILARNVADTLAETVNEGAAYSLRLAQELDDPVLAGVVTPNGRFRVEALQSSIIALYDNLVQNLGPALGVNPGFNALDGD